MPNPHQKHRWPLDLLVTAFVLGLLLRLARRAVRCRNRHSAGEVSESDKTAVRCAKPGRE